MTGNRNNRTTRMTSITPIRAAAMSEADDLADAVDQELQALTAANAIVTEASPPVPAVQPEITPQWSSPKVSATASADLLRKATDRAVEILTKQRDARVEQLNQERATRANDFTQKIDAANSAKHDALHIANVNAAQAQILQEQDAKDAEATRILIQSEAEQYNAMLSTQRSVLAQLNLPAYGATGETAPVTKEHEYDERKT